MIWLYNPLFVLFWIGCAWLIGLLGCNKRYGFFGNFLVSLVFSPVVGVIVLLASDERKEKSPS